MDENNNNVGTLLQRKRKNVKVGKEEVLLIARAYLEHPTRWSDILEEIRQNLDRLSPDARRLYQTGNFRQLRDRMCGKLGSLVKKQPEHIQDVDIRTVVTEIQQKERRLQMPLRPQPQQPDQQAQNPAPGPDMAEVRDFVANALSSSSEAENEGAEAEVPNRVQPPPQRAGRRRRKRPLAYLIRENHELYNKFIKDKVPKLLRQLGVSSSDESD